MSQTRNVREPPSERRSGRRLLLTAPIVALAAIAALVVLHGRWGPVRVVAEQPKGEDAPAFDRQVDILYTVNNLGYTDTCG